MNTETAETKKLDKTHKTPHSVIFQVGDMISDSSRLRVGKKICDPGACVYSTSGRCINCTFHRT